MPQQQPRPRKKNQLHCHECSHKDPIDGDWVHDGSTEKLRLICPECDTCILDQSSTTLSR